MARRPRCMPRVNLRMACLVRWFQASVVRGARLAARPARRRLGDRARGRRPQQPANFTSKLAADRVTIIGDPAANQSGARTYANSAGDDFEVRIHDSILSGITHRSTATLRRAREALPPTGRAFPRRATGAAVPAALWRARTPSPAPRSLSSPRRRLPPAPRLAAGRRRRSGAANGDRRPRRAESPGRRTDLGAYEYQRQSVSPPTLTTRRPALRPTARRPSPCSSGPGCPWPRPCAAGSRPPSDAPRRAATGPACCSTPAPPSACMSRVASRAASARPISPASVGERSASSSPAGHERRFATSRASSSSSGRPPRTSPETPAPPAPAGPRCAADGSSPARGAKTGVGSECDSRRNFPRPGPCIAVHGGRPGTAGL